MARRQNEQKKDKPQPITTHGGGAAQRYRTTENKARRLAAAKCKIARDRIEYGPRLRRRENPATTLARQRRRASAAHAARAQQERNREMREASQARLEQVKAAAVTNAKLGIAAGGVV